MECRLCDVVTLQLVTLCVATVAARATVLRNAKTALKATNTTRTMTLGVTVCACRRVLEAGNMFDCCCHDYDQSSAPVKLILSIVSRAWHAPTCTHTPIIPLHHLADSETRFTQILMNARPKNLRVKTSKSASTRRDHTNVLVRISLISFLSTCTCICRDVLLLHVRDSLSCRDTLRTFCVRIFFSVQFACVCLPRPRMRPRL